MGCAGKINEGSEPGWAQREWKPGSRIFGRNHSGVSTFSSQKKRCVNFLEKKMKNNPSLTFPETIQVCLSSE